MQVIRLPLDSVEPDPNQARKFFDKNELGNLAANIAEHGVLEPILVRTDGKLDRFILIAGERRWRASRIAGLADIPAIVRDDIKATGTLDEVSISENTSRQDLNPVEEARAFDRLRNERGYEIDNIARKVGKGTTFVWGRLSLLKLSPELLQMVEVGQMGPLTGQTIARLPKEHQFLAFRAWNEGQIGDNALRLFVDQLEANLAATQLFTDEEVQKRSKDAKALRERFDAAIARATEAIGMLVDHKKNALLAEALKGDYELYNEKLKLLEQECRRLRSAISTAKANNLLLKESA